MLSFLIANGYALFVVVPFIALLWFATILIFYLFYKIIRGEI